MKSLQILLLYLLLHLCLSKTPPRLQQKYIWKFVARETFISKGMSVSHPVTSVACPASGRSAPVTLVAPKSQFRGLDGWTAPRRRYDLCLLYEQTEERCRQQPDTYRGCPYYSCKYRVWNTYQPWWFTIPDPWDCRWEKGVKGKLYQSIAYSYPQSTLEIYQTLVLVLINKMVLANTILDQEQSLQTLI